MESMELMESNNLAIYSEGKWRMKLTNELCGFYFSTYMIYVYIEKFASTT